ncbi:apolipoprotein N-acyltransferase [Olivibacter sitiensis]|uniref:apolipoprotein N-acyltransferase n=1 Tax=Olivibacter sitiensis TaxID=376470 RepID=UPI00042A6ACC|nr:apolipoprotein N-acyltransferase [Olivibacter sitiensis]
MKRNYLLALSSALLLWLAWPPIPFTGVILLVAFVPLLLALEQIITSPGKKKGTKVFLTAGLCALVWNTASIYWVFNAISAVMPIYAAIFISLIPFGLAALLIALVFRLYYQLRKTYNLGVSLIGLACFWVCYEYLHQWWDLAFPWMTLGNGFANSTVLVQWYEYTGVYGGTLWIWICNILFFILFIRHKQQSKASFLTSYLALAAIVFVPIACSLLRYTTYEENENPSNIVVAQPNIEPFKKYGLSANQQVDLLIRLSQSVGQPNTEFFIWPETAISSYVNEREIRSDIKYEKTREFLKDYKNGNVLSGIESFSKMAEPSPNSTPIQELDRIYYYERYNAAVLIDNSSKVQFYHKSKLVPGVEQLPFSALSFLKPLFAAFGGATGSYAGQEEPSVFYSSSGIGAAPVICYESIWGNYVAEYIRQGAQFIAIITNDGWWGNTSGKSQHLDYARLRAIETRRWVARSANTGISAFINQRGDVVQRSTWWTATALKQDINLNEELTFYVRFGDYVAYVAMIGGFISILLVIFGLIKRQNPINQK